MSADKDKSKDAAPAADGGFTFSSGFGAIASGTSSGWGSFGTGGGFGGTDSGFGAFTAGASTSSAEETTSAGADKGSDNPEEENQTRYEPVIHLKPVDVDSGEKDEDEVYKQCVQTARSLPAQLLHRSAARHLNK
jgi:hypothetical protein